MPKPKAKKNENYDWRTSQEWRDGWNAAIDNMNHHLQNLPVKFITKAPLPKSPKKEPL